MPGQRQRAAKQYFNHRKVKTVDNMRTYAELVKEAIREAHEKSENEYKKFEVGRTYATRSVCNSECIFKITIIKRTEKTVTIDKGDGKTKRCKIYTDMRNAEAIYPYGIYSMCPIIDASEKIA